MNRGRVVKCVGGAFTINSGDADYVLQGRGKFKLEGKILPGDIVEFHGDAIDRLLPRKNELIRPAIANIDKLLVMLAPVPKTDYLLIDKLILCCYLKGIEPVLICNKSDILAMEEAAAEYKRCVTKIITLSALKKINVDEILEYINGSFSCLSGQSAVGKSTLLNSLIGKGLMPTGELSLKAERGRHTTRHTEIFRLGKDTYIADTPGFSNLNLSGLEAEELQRYYDDFQVYAGHCRYQPCTHISEPGCAVRQAAESGAITMQRYIRYKKIFEELKDNKPVSTKVEKKRR